jgi:hypothetical protein
VDGIEAGTYTPRAADYHHRVSSRDAVEHHFQAVQQESRSVAFLTEKATMSLGALYAPEAKMLQAVTGSQTGASL